MILGLSAKLASEGANAIGERVFTVYYQLCNVTAPLRFTGRYALSWTDVLQLQNSMGLVNLDKTACDLTFESNIGST